MVGLDFETTGVDPFTDRPVQIGLVYSPGRGVYETVMDKIVDPEMDIGEEAASIHGISNAIAKERGQSLQGQITMLLTHLNGYRDLGVPLVIYNAPFDWTMLKAQASEWGLESFLYEMPILDPLVWSRAVHRYKKGGHGMGEILEMYGMENPPGRHDAADDARMAIQLARAIPVKHEQLSRQSIPGLQPIQQFLFADKAIDFQAYLRKERDPQAFIDRGWPEKDGPGQYGKSDLAMSGT